MYQYEEIYGTSLISLEVKVVISNHNQFNTYFIESNMWVLNDNHNVKIDGCITFIGNMMPLFFTISRDMKLTTMGNIWSRTARNVLKSISHVSSIYYNRGFKVIEMLMDK